MERSYYSFQQQFIVVRSLTAFSEKNFYSLIDQFFEINIYLSEVKITLLIYIKITAVIDIKIEFCKGKIFAKS